MIPETSRNEPRSRTADSGVRLAELMAALSIATDLGMGQPLESALCSCVVAMRLGEALNLDGYMLRDVYYQAYCVTSAATRTPTRWPRCSAMNWRCAESSRPSIVVGLLKC